MKVLGLFDGISTGRLAMDRAGFKNYTYFSSEIAKFPNLITEYNYPDNVQLGDVSELETPENLDMVIGGSPCNSFSFAGKMAGMVTDSNVEITTLKEYLRLKRLGFSFTGQSYLFWEYMRIIEEAQPRIILLENVRMLEKWEYVLSEAIGFRPQKINSNLVSAQNRYRLYWLGCRTKYGYKQIPIEVEDRCVAWEDIRERNVVQPSMYYSVAGLRWIGRHGISRKKKLKLFSTVGKVQMIEASHHKKYSSQRFFGVVDTPDFNTEERRKVMEDYPGVFPVLPAGSALRYITPLECEKAQTLPDLFTAKGSAGGISDTQRYTAIGNGWTAEIIVELLEAVK